MKLVNQLVPNKYAKAITPGTNTRQYVTIHETGNQSRGANAKAHANLQSGGNSRAASWHIQVDEKQAIRSWLDETICWHAGASYPRVSGNPRSIGIEICVNSDGDYKGAVRNAASVTAHLMKKHGIPIGNVVQHNFWSGKNCPTNLRNGRKGINWTQFKQMVLAEYSGRGSTTVPTVPLPYSAVLDIGSQGAAVTRYQADVTLLGYTLEVDGIYGEASKGATVKFQKASNLHVDGIAGIDTQIALVKAVAAHMKEHEESQGVIHPTGGDVAATPNSPTVQPSDSTLTIEFSSGTLRREVETFLASKLQQEIAVKTGVEQGYSETWLTTDKATPGDKLALLLGSAIKLLK